MPRSRRARRGRLVAVPGVLWRYLADLQDPGDEEDPAFLDFYFFHDPAPEAELWAELGAAATAAHARVYPRWRPRLWWRYDVPGAPFPERQQVGGSGWPSAGSNGYGKYFYCGIDPADPPMVESQAAFFLRHGLLLPGEQVPPEEFEPEVATDWRGGDDDGGDDPPPGAAHPVRQAA
jgi:hypothetical protein